MLNSVTSSSIDSGWLKTMATENWNAVVCLSTIWGHFGIFPQLIILIFSLMYVDVYAFERLRCCACIRRNVGWQKCYNPIIEWASLTSLCAPNMKKVVFTCAHVILNMFYFVFILCSIFILEPTLFLSLSIITYFVIVTKSVLWHHYVPNIYHSVVNINGRVLFINMLCWCIAYVVKSNIPIQNIPSADRACVSTHVSPATQPKFVSIPSIYKYIYANIDCRINWAEK